MQVCLAAVIRTLSGHQAPTESDPKLPWTPRQRGVIEENAWRVYGELVGGRRLGGRACDGEAQQSVERRDVIYGNLSFQPPKPSWSEVCARRADGAESTSCPTPRLHVIESSH